MTSHDLTPRGTPPAATLRGRAPARAVRLDLRSSVLLAAVAVMGLLAFTWPLLVRPESTLAGTTQAPLVFALLLPVVIAVALSQLTGQGMDVKALAVLGVLSALGAVLRPLGAGVAGLEGVLFLVVLGGRVFGPGFGFVLGTTTLFSSALLTAGVGPWLPFQMLAAGFVGLGAGLLPGLRGRAEVALLAGYAVVSSFAYGALMDLSFWPFTLGNETALSYSPGASVGENLHRFWLYNLATAMGWNAGRALANALLVLVAGPAVLAVLRRAARRARFT